jgi:hypothetical protein
MIAVALTKALVLVSLLGGDIHESGLRSLTKLEHVTQFITKRG